MSSVIMYTKNVCPYCTRAKQLLQSKGVEWTEINIETEPGRRDEMIERSGLMTVPQIFIGDVHVGGFDEMAALEGEGKLDPLLELGRKQAKDTEGESVEHRKVTQQPRDQSITRRPLEQRHDPRHVDQPDLLRGLQVE